MLKSDIYIYIYIQRKRERERERENCKKLKPNWTFEFIDWDKNCDKYKFLKFEQKKDDIRQCRWMKICDNYIEFR